MASLDALTLPAVSAGLPSQLLARRPDVAEAEAQLMAANANIAAARAAFFPSIELTASGGFESAALAAWLSPATACSRSPPASPRPIFHHGALLGQYQLSKARYAELLADYHKTVLTALGNVEDALVAVQQTRRAGAAAAGCRRQGAPRVRVRADCSFGRAPSTF